MSSFLERDVRAEKNRRVYEAARENHPALAGHESVESALDALAYGSRANNAERDAVTRALVVEYQRGRLGFWAAVLVLAYLPMIGKLRGRIVRDVRRDGIDEAHQVVVDAFMKVIAAVRPDRGWICLTLRRETERRVFKVLRHERRINAVVRTTTPHGLDRAAALEPDGPWLPVSSPARRVQFAPDERDEAEVFLRDRARGVLDEEEIGLVVATTIRGEPIAKYVTRQRSYASTRERHREYERLKRRHTRAIDKLQAALGEGKADACPWGA